MHHRLYTSANRISPIRIRNTKKSWQSLIGGDYSDINHKTLMQKGTIIYTATSRSIGYIAAIKRIHFTENYVKSFGIFMTSPMSVKSSAPETRLVTLKPPKTHVTKPLSAKITIGPALLWWYTWLRFLQSEMKSHSCSDTILLCLP